MCDSNFISDGNIMFEFLKGQIVPYSSFFQEIIRIKR